MRYSLLLLIPVLGCATHHQQANESHSLKTKAAVESLYQCNFPDAVGALSSIDDEILRYEWSHEDCGTHRIDSYPTEVAIDYVKNLGKEITKEFKKCGPTTFETSDEFEHYKNCIGLVTKVRFPFEEYVKGKHSEYKDERRKKKFMKVNDDNLPFCEATPVIKKCVEKKIDLVTEKFQKKQSEIMKSEQRAKTLQPLRLGICALEEKIVSLKKMKSLPELESATKKQRYDLDLSIIKLEENRKLAILGYQATGEKWSEDNCTNTMEMIKPKSLIDQSAPVVKQSI